MAKNQYPKIQAYLAHLGVASRRKIEDLIRAKKVQVNGVLAEIGQRVKPAEDVLVVDGRKIEPTPAQPIYILLDKPVGYVSTTSDEEGRKTVLDLVNTKERVYPVGRLDIDSEGLMILTNDGDFAFKMTHPSSNIKKIYHVLLLGVPSTLALNHLKRGVKLGGQYVQPDQVNILRHEDGLSPQQSKNTWLEIALHEGQNRQVRKMMRRIGYQVLRLQRTAMGPFNLDMLEGKTSLILNKKQVIEIFSS